MGKSVNDIMAAYKDRRMANSGRNSDFARLHAVYQGHFYDPRNQDNMDGSGRVIMRDNRRGERAQPLVANLLKGIVDDYISMTGGLPDIKVPAPDETKEGQDFADQMEKFHYGVWWASNMTMQLKSMAWWNSALGGCSAIVWPNFQKRHAEIRFVGPDKVYGTPDLIDPFAFSSAIVAESYSAQTIKDFFPQKQVQDAIASFEGERRDWTGKKGRVEIIRFFDKQEVVTVMCREVTAIKTRNRSEPSEMEALVEMGRARHDLGLCPVVPFQNILVPGESRGMSDIEQAVGLNQFANFLLNANEEYVLQELTAPLILIDSEKAPEDINLEDPRAIIAIRAGGDAKRLQSSANGEMVMNQQLQRTQEFITLVTGDPQVRTEGRMRSSITTGRGIEKAQGPVFGRIEYRNDMNSFRLEKVNELSVLMTAKMFAGEEIKLFGTRTRRGGMFRINIKGEDLQEYTFNKVIYSPSMHMGLSERITNVLQLRGAQPRPMIDERTGIEVLGFSDHPDEMMRRIAVEMEEDVAFKMRLEKAAKGGEEPYDPLAPQREMASLEGGGMPKPPPGLPAATSDMALPPSGPAAAIASAMPMTLPELPTATATSGLEESPDITAQVREAIATMTPAVKGAVYLLPQTGEKIQLVTTNYVEARRIRRRLAELFGNRVTVRESKRIPEGAVQVAGAQVAV